jgi:hypothetical protein
MAVSIKSEGGDHPLLIDPKTELITGDTGDDETGGGVDFLDYAGDALEIVASGAGGGLLGGKLAADAVLEKLPRPCSALNCRQARSYLVKLLRYVVPSVFGGLCRRLGGEKGAGGSIAKSRSREVMWTDVVFRIRIGSEFYQVGGTF